MSCSDKENNVVLCFNSELSMVLSFVTKKATALKSVVKYLLGCGDAMNNLIAKSNYNNYMSRFRHFRLSYLQQWKCKWMTCSEPITLTKEGFGCTSFILRFVMGLLSHSSFRQPQLAVYGATRQGPLASCLPHHSPGGSILVWITAASWWDYLNSSCLITPSDTSSLATISMTP